MTRTPVPEPCIVQKYDGEGHIVSTDVVVRPPLKQSGSWESDSVKRCYRVMAVQETGEEQLVDFAPTRTKAEAIAREHLANHPEHRATIVERM